MRDCKWLADNSQRTYQFPESDSLAGVAKLELTCTVNNIMKSGVPETKRYVPQIISRVKGLDTCCQGIKWSKFEG